MTNLRNSLVLSLVLVVSGCAHYPKSMYRGELFIHQVPNYFFQIPEGWRAARADDYDRFGFNQRMLQRINDQGRQILKKQTERSIAAAHAVLISSRGSALVVTSGVNQGVRYAPGYKLNDREQSSLWSEISKAMIAGAPPDDKPTLTFKSMKIAQYGPNTTLVTKFIAEMQAGALQPTAIGFFGPSNTVVMMHIGLPGDPDEGLEAVEGAARTLRFE